jgi:hypothetical protein
MLLQCPDLKVPEHYYGISLEKMQSTLDSEIIVIFYFLKNFYSSFEILRSKLKYLTGQLGKEGFTSNSNVLSGGKILLNKTLISLCLPYLLPEDVGFKNIGIEKRMFFIERYNCTVHFNGFIDSRRYLPNFMMATIGDSADSEEILMNPYEVLLDVFDTCQKLGALK